MPCKPPLIPKGILDHINNLILSFLWGDTATQKHVHLLNCDSITKSERDEGLRIRDATACNDAFLMNQAWRLWRNEDTMLAKFIRLKHCRQTEFLNTMSRTGSHSWEALIRGCNLLKTGLRWVVGTGHHINFWTDHWLPPGPVRGLIYGPLLSHEYVYRVERFINPNQQWDFSSLSMVLPDNITQNIVAQPLPISQAPHLNDIRAWQSSSGLCSVKSAYYFLMQNREESRVLQRESWGWIWKLKLPPKIQLFIWKCAHQRLPTNSFHFNRMHQHNQHCSRCMEVETPLHVLRDCSYARHIWLSFPQDMLISEFFHLDLPSCCKRNTKINTRVSYVPWGVLFAFTVWAIWLSRNSLVFSGKLITFSSLEK